MSFRKIAYSIFVFCFITSCNIKDNKQIPQRPNIIFIMSDDHAYQAISAYGGSLAELAPTPNIDQLAKEGMRFNRCLVTNSICGPSRATIFSGKYSHLNGFVDNSKESKFDFDQPFFAKNLHQAGYQTAVIGKLHLGGVPTHFDYCDILPGQGHYYNPMFINKSEQYQEEGYVTEIITDKTIKWLNKVKDSQQPFMVMVWQKAPHRTWDPGPNELGMYENVTFPEPETLFDNYSGNREAASLNNMTIAETMTLKRDLKMTDKPRKGLNEEQTKKWNATYNPIYQDFLKTNPKGKELVRFKYQRYMRDYLACVSAIDKSVGKILDYLKQNGLDKNTIVVYSSDQGFYLGEHGWFDKRWMYKESLRTPLLVRWPGVVKPGTVNDDMVSNLDFAETFIDIAGANIPDEMQGRSLLPLLKSNTPDDWRKEHYYHYYECPQNHNVKRHYGITTDKYKLIHFYYDIDEWELYDLQKDPNEMKNVYNEPEYIDVKKELHEKLEELRNKYNDNDSLNQQFIKKTIEKSKQLKK